MNTMVALTPRLLSIFILILIIYYAFAIVGLEFFSFQVSKGCCNESWYGVQLFYSAAADSANATDVDSPYVYYLNNFNNILSSYGEHVFGVSECICTEYVCGQPLSVWDGKGSAMPQGGMVKDQQYHRVRGMAKGQQYHRVRGMVRNVSSTTGHVDMW